MRNYALHEQPDPIQTCLAHIHALAVDIGPRGSTIEGKRRIAAYCLTHLDRLGLSAVSETFSSARSIFTPHLIASLMMLAAFDLYPVAGRWSAAAAFVIALVSLVSELLELGFKHNLLRRVVPKGLSQNVVATISPREEHRQDLVLIGHIDNQRTPLIFKSKAWLVNPKALVLEMWAAGPGWLTRKGIIVPIYADPGLLALVEQLSKENPAWGAYPAQINGGNTELADCVRFKVPALTLFGLPPPRVMHLSGTSWETLSIKSSRQS